MHDQDADPAYAGAGLQRISNIEDPKEDVAQPKYVCQRKEPMLKISTCLDINAAYNSLAICLVNISLPDLLIAMAGVAAVSFLSSTAVLPISAWLWAVVLCRADKLPLASSSGCAEEL